jgi:hypothetical protein
MQPSFTRGQLPQTALLGPVILKISLYLSHLIIIGIRIDEKGLDPGTLIHFKVVTTTHEISSYQVFHSFYEEMRSRFFHLCKR